MRKREVSLIGKSEQNPKFQISHLHLLTVTAGGGVSGLVPLTMIIDSEELLRNLLLYLSKTGNLQRMVSLLIVLVFWLVQALRLLRREKLPFKIGGLVISVILAEISFDQWSDYVTKQLYRHFGLNWAFVDPKAPIKSGTKFCVCVKEFFPWLMMPLQVVYVTENKNSKNGASFSFGSGTLQGHLLAGEERFSIALDENDVVWYEILSFSKPAHPLSLFGYPYVLLRQKYFAHQSGSAVKKHLSA